MPSRSAVTPPSVVGTMIGAPLAPRIGAPSIRLKSPRRKSAVGTDAGASGPRARTCLPSRRRRTPCSSGSDRRGCRRRCCGVPLGFSVDAGAILVPDERAQRAVVVQRERAAAELVRARLRDHGDRGAAGHALLGVEVVGGDVHFLDALDRRDVDGVMRHRHQDVGRAVDAGVVGAALLAVDVGRQRASRRVGHGVLEPRGCGARHEVDRATGSSGSWRAAGSARSGFQVRADVRLRGLEHRARAHPR